MPGDSATNRVNTVGIVIALLLFSCLLLPALAQSNSNADRSLCMKRMWDISKSLIKFEDTTTTFPIASTQPFDHKPGSLEDKTVAGYSWLVRITPFLDAESTYWDGLTWHSKRLTVPPFAPALKTIVDKQEVHPATHSFTEFLCPSYDGGRHVPKENSDYKSIAGQMPAVANYHAFAGSHFINREGIGEFPPVVMNNQLSFNGDGVIPFPGRNAKPPYRRGMRMSQVVDGAAHTLVFAESLEREYSAFIDGQAMWLVAAWPGNVQIPSLKPDESLPANPVLSWDRAAKKHVRASIALQEADGSTTTYLDDERWSGSRDRRWGPSSNHSGIVAHGFADGRVVMLSTDIDAEVYLHMATHNGREILPDSIADKLIHGYIPPDSP